MAATLLSLLLSLQLLFGAPFTRSSVPSAQPRRLWWGMIDPELSLWYTQIPDDAGSEADPILWNWSWQGFWAALTRQPLVKEAADATPL